MTSREDRAAHPGVEAQTEDAPAAEGDALDALIPEGLQDGAAAVSRASAPQKVAEPRLRIARLVGVRGRDAEVVFRRAQAPVACEIAAEVELVLLQDVMAQGGSVLVEEDGEGVPLVVGVVATRRPQTLELKAGTVTIEGEREILLRSGRGAIRIREDGDIEVVGTRISATSRGLFRLVGRLLRLN